MTPHISKVKLPYSNKEHLAPEALVRWSYKMALVQVHLQGRDFESQRGRAPCPSPLPLNDQKNKKQETSDKKAPLTYLLAKVWAHISLGMLIHAL